MCDPTCRLLPASFREDLRRAVRLFIECAYGSKPSARALEYLPPEGEYDPAAWLMGDRMERTPSEAPFEEVQDFALRIGSRHYRHLKLRICRTGAERDLVFVADSHDSFLQAEPGSPERDGIEALKRSNAEVVARITDAWDAAGINTERNYLRERILRARKRLGVR
jgi:hypothetical protein